MNQEHTHEHTVTNELICHLPYAVFSVAFALTILSVLSAFSLGVVNKNLVKLSSRPSGISGEKLKGKLK